MGVFLKDYGFFIPNVDRHTWGVSGSARFGRIAVVSDCARALLESERGRVRAVSVRASARSQTATAAKPNSAADRSVASRVYTMNVSKFRRKAFAYACLRRSMRFLAFYSVSFPAGMPDDVGFRIWNKVLTRLRRDLRLKSYMWVMERQRNGTLHYHMLTNDFMNVQEVNRYVAVAIENEVNAGHCGWGSSSLERYNGVDVHKVTGSSAAVSAQPRMRIIAKVANYLTKYMSKEVRSETHRVWHCSRLVSALFVTAAVEEADMREIVDQFEQSGREVKVIQCEFGSVVICPVIDSVAFRDTIVRLNDAVYTYFERHNLF